MSMPDDELLEEDGELDGGIEADLDPSDSEFSDDDDLDEDM